MHRCKRLLGDGAIEQDLGRIRTIVAQAARLGDGLPERQIRLFEIEPAADAGAPSARNVRRS